jgi:4-hydroxy-2-oxoheptanedioate aldolase
VKDIKKSLKNGEVVIGTFNIIPHPSVTEMLGYAGFDFLLIDCEQGALSPWGTELETMIRAAYAVDVTPIVRITENDAGMITKALNLGARGVVIPHVNTKEEMVKAVNAAKFAPQGNRTAAPITRAAKHGAIPWSDFIKSANEEVIVIALLEEKAAMDNMEDILSVEGLDVAFFGPFDLAVRLGAVGDPDTEAQLSRYRRKLIKLCNKRGIFVANDVDLAIDLKRSVDEGCRVITYSNDFSMLGNGIWRAVEDARKIMPGCLQGKGLA